MLFLLLVNYMKFNRVQCSQRVFLPHIDGSDYSGLTATYTFDSIISTIDVPVPIIDDSIFELTELFSASLAFPGAPIPRVSLAPDFAEVTILDDDGQHYIKYCMHLSLLWVYHIILHCFC